MGDSSRRPGALQCVVVSTAYNELIDNESIMGRGTNINKETGPIHLSSLPTFRRPFTRVNKGIPKDPQSMLDGAALVQEA